MSNQRRPAPEQVRNDTPNHPRIGATTSAAQETEPCFKDDASGEVKEQRDGQPARRVVQNLRSAGISLMIGLLPLYFLVFAILAYRNNNAEVRNGSQADWLLQAAKIGPTVFPIVFAAIVGQLMTVIASWQLENRVRIGLLESLLASRSLGAAILSLIKLRIISVWVPLILVTWSLSPLGGQSSLRVVTSVPSYQQSVSGLEYVNVLKSQPIILGASSQASSLNLVTAAFNTFMASPASSKNGTQDMYGNLNIPMIEALDTESAVDGWWNISNEMTTTKVSLVGIPMAGVPTSGNTTFDLKTVYFSPNCSVSTTTFSSSVGNTSYSWSSQPNHTNWNLEGSQLTGTVYGYDNTGLRLMDRDPTHNAKSSTARRLGVQSVQFYETVTNAMCDLYMTHAEVTARCIGGPSNCSVTAIRRTPQPPFPNTATFLDDIAWVNDTTSSSNTTALLFFQDFAMSYAKGGHQSDYSALQQYFLTPANPLSTEASSGLGTPLGDIGSQLFSIRLAQLLNGYWYATTFPDALIGGFSTQNDSDLQSAPKANASAQVETVLIVLRYHRLWGAILIITSGLLVVAGIVTAILDMLRRGPAVLDHFVNSLRHSPYVDLKGQPAMGDGDDLARALQHKEVQLGDMRPDEEVGTVAVAMPTAMQPVERLKKRRLYA